MLVFNQQANIKNVNGAIADTFANRPAPQSTFYIFYSIDTQEIYYDNGTWILISSAAAPSVNIYNSDGTLTDNRVLDGNGNNLQFDKLSGVNFNQIFGFQLNADDIIFDPMSFVFSAPFRRIYTNFQFQNIGLNIDFANAIYEFGQITGGNQSIFKIDDTTQIVNIQKSGIDGGIEVDLSNNTVRLGDWFSLHGGHKIDIVPTDITMKAGGINNPAFRINSQIDLIATYFQSDINGINLDFANRNYYFGQSTGNNRTVLIVDDTNQIINTFSQNNDKGLKLDFANTTYQLGQLTGGNTTYLTINDSATYPVQIDGTNVLSGTSGSTSGQHLKIKINGVDYKIELKNP